MSWLSTFSSLNCNWSNCAYSKLKSLSVLLYIVEVGGVVNGACRLYYRLASERVCGIVVFRYSYVEVARDAFILLKLVLGPLPVVHKLCQGLLQILENACVGALYLTVVYRDSGIQFLGC